MDTEKAGKDAIYFAQLQQVIEPNPLYRGISVAPPGERNPKNE